MTKIVYRIFAHGKNGKPIAIFTEEKYAKSFARLNKDYDIDKDYYMNKMTDEILIEIKIRL